MKVSLIFNLPEERPEYDIAMKGMNFSIALDRIRNEVFRPHRKHGYGSTLLDSDAAYDIIEALESMFNTIMEEEDAYDK